MDGPVSPGRAAYSLGQCFKLGGPENKDALIEVCNAAVASDLIYPAYDRDGVWVVEKRNGNSLMPAPMKGDAYGFKNRDYAWLYWLGLGMPEETEIRFILQPSSMTDHVFEKEDAEIMDVLNDVVDDIETAEKAIGVRELKVLVGGKS